MLQIHADACKSFGDPRQFLKLVNRELNNFIIKRTGII